MQAKIKFPQSAEASIFCPICFTLLSQPISLPCGHLCCQSHIKDPSLLAGHCKCPSCIYRQKSVQESALTHISAVKACVKEIVNSASVLSPTNLRIKDGSHQPKSLNLLRRGVYHPPRLSIHSPKPSSVEVVVKVINPHNSDPYLQLAEAVRLLVTSEGSWYNGVAGHHGCVLPCLGTFTEMVGGVGIASCVDLWNPHGNLDDWLNEKTVTRKLSLEAVCQITAAVAIGVRFLHSQNIVHGRLKPTNILMTCISSELLDDTDISPCVVSDFVRSESSGKQKCIYSAPEVQGETGVSKEADVYSIGVLLWALLICVDPCSTPLIDKGSFPEIEINPSWPHELQALLPRCLNKNPNDRPTVGFLCSALERLGVSSFDSPSPLFCQWLNSVNEIQPLMELAEKSYEGKRSQRVKLNVGGTLFETTAGTLMGAMCVGAPKTTEGCQQSGAYVSKSEKQSGKRNFFSNLLAGAWNETSKTSPSGTIEVFIDRSPVHFDLILSFLRKGRVNLPDADHVLADALDEARFYNLDELVAFIEARLTDQYEASRFNQKRTNDGVIEQIASAVASVASQGGASGGTSPCLPSSTPQHSAPHSPLTSPLSARSPFTHFPVHITRPPGYQRSNSDTSAYLTSMTGSRRHSQSTLCSGVDEGGGPTSLIGVARWRNTGTVAAIDTSSRIERGGNGTQERKLPPFPSDEAHLSHVVPPKIEAHPPPASASLTRLSTASDSSSSSSPTSAPVSLPSLTATPASERRTTGRGDWLNDYQIDITPGSSNCLASATNTQRRNQSDTSTLLDPFPPRFRPSPLRVNPSPLNLLNACTTRGAPELGVLYEHRREPFPAKSDASQVFQLINDDNSPPPSVDEGEAVKLLGDATFNTNDDDF
eukprot:GHVN01034564.1.p2 GENE.GHVN01034564.1~~GHVN01034564.1.p2  ORF type:complete len:879 (+),score=129.16 GHVN01034564.1:4910-7546(+)